MTQDNSNIPSTDEHIKIDSVKETLDWLRDVREGIEKDKKVDRNTVYSLESHFDDITSKVGPVNGFTQVGSTIGLESVSSFIDEKIRTEENNLVMYFIREFDHIKTTFFNNSEKIDAFFKYIQETYRYPNDNEDGTPAIIPVNTVSRLVEFIADPKTQAFFSLLLKDLTNVKNIEFRNIKNIYKEQPVTDITFIPVTDLSSLQAFNDLQNVYRDEAPPVSSFSELSFSLESLLLSVQKQQNQTELSTDIIEIAIRQTSLLLTANLIDINELTQGNAAHELGSGTDLLPPSTPFVKDEVKQKYQDTLSKLENNYDALRTTLTNLNGVIMCRSRIFEALQVITKAN